MARTKGKAAIERRTTNTVTAKADQHVIFADIRALLEKYEPRMEARTDAKGGYHLWSKSGMTDARGKDKECYFAGVVPQKGYVGFYYMPVYTDSERKVEFDPGLLALLKGKSCFYVRRLDPGLKKQIREALQSGYKLYKSRGWV
jgi:hypothetical protein